MCPYGWPGKTLRWREKPRCISSCSSPHPPYVMGMQRSRSWELFQATRNSNWPLKPVWLSTAHTRWLKAALDSCSLQDPSPCTFLAHLFLLASLASCTGILRAQIFNHPIIFTGDHESPGELCPTLRYITFLSFVIVNQGPMETGSSDADINIYVLRSLNFWTRLGHLVSPGFVNASVKKL